MKYSMLFIVMLFLPINVSAAIINAGATNGIWFSENRFFAEDTVTIYANIYNQSDRSISGNAVFFADKQEIGSKRFTLNPDSANRIFINWKATSGNKDFKIELKDTKDNDGKNITLSSNTLTTKYFVDTDTDKDGEGNKTDSDDDNDGISDVEEIKNGTNPLVADVPKQNVRIGTTNKDESTTNPQNIASKLRALALNTVNTLTNAGTETINTIDPIAHDTSVAMEKKRDKIMHNYVATSTTATSSIKNLPNSENFASVFTAIKTLFGDSNMSISDKIKTIFLSVFALLVNYWLWILVFILFVILWRILYKWQARDY